MKTTQKSATGRKDDSGKPRMELLSNLALRGTAAVLTVGATEYKDHNWRNGLAWSRLLGACARHLFAFQDGEDLDPKTGLPHLDHLACEVMFLQEEFRTRKDLDDRFKVPDRGGGGGGGGGGVVRLHSFGSGIAMSRGAKRSRK